jgi:hypothetical protein
MGKKKEKEEDKKNKKKKQLIFYWDSALSRFSFFVNVAPKKCKKKTLLWHVLSI